MRALVGLVSLAIILIAGATSFNGSDPPLAPADPALYDIPEGFCAEPDIFNVSDEPVRFALQAVLASGERSEMHYSELLQPGDRGHFHIFSDAWIDPTGVKIKALAAEINEFGCDIVVFRAPDDYCCPTGTRHS